MTYDIEKYRAKRERVLGVRKRTLSFGAIAATVSVLIVLGLSMVVIPKSVAYLQNRNLEDVIYKLADSSSWSADIVPAVMAEKGVQAVVRDKNGSRLIITFDRTVVDTGKLVAFFRGQGVDPIQLNHVGHSERMTLINREGSK